MMFKTHEELRERMAATERAFQRRMAANRALGLIEKALEGMVSSDEGQRMIREAIEHLNDALTKQGEKP